ncbi:MAG: TonB-dependent receptor [Opitutaceae bacterium]|nr:TonB-dependent receptor [Opitutaceae bacterium]
MGYTNALSESRVKAALARTDSTAFNIFGGPNFKNNSDTINSFKVTSQKGGSAELNLFDAKVSGPLFDLPTGELRGAVYTEYRTENFNEENDAISTTLDDIIGQVKLASSTRALRNVKSVAAEIGLPLVKAKTVPYIFDLSLSVAARYESFSDGYNSGVKPYYGLRYQPIKSLLIRGSYTEAFRAPTLPQLFGGVRESLPSGLADYARPQALTGDPFDGTATQRLVKAGGNPNLTPETAESYQVGAVWELPYKALKGLSIEATIGEIAQNNIITTTGTSFLRSNEFGDAAGLIVRLPGTQTYTNNTASAITVYKGPGARLSSGADVVVQPGQSIVVPGQILYLSDTTVNLAYQRVRYLDIALRYTIKTTNWGRFTADSSLTYTREYTFTKTPGGALTNYVDRDGYPRYRVQSHIGWKLRSYEAGLINNFMPSYGKVDYDGYRTAQYSTFNAFVSHQFSSKSLLLAGTKLTLGMDNLLDQDPPLYYNAVGYDQSYVGRPQGRFGYITLKKEF